MAKYTSIIIGGSAGSITPLLELLGTMKYTNKVSIFVIVHRLKNQQSNLAHILSAKVEQWRIVESEDKAKIEGGIIYLAPANYHLLFEEQGTLSLDYSELVNFSRPSIDVAFESAADILGESVIAVLLSGANQDGAAGIRKIREAQGLTIVQEPETAENATMPLAGLASNAVDYILPAASIGTFVNTLLKK